MAKMILTLDLDDDAIAESPTEEVPRLLRAVACAIEQGEQLPITLRDVNGNTVGTVRIEEQ